MKISKKLCELFDGIKLGGIHASDGVIYLLQYVRYTNQNFAVINDIRSAKIPSKTEIQHAGQMCMVRKFIAQIKKIEEEVQKLNNECSDDSLAGFVNLGDFLTDNILIMPPTPRRQ
ncbi:hypothetical protein F8M41_001179 [Gigaspora margarita]|uniref:Uncharacterized protein n=1 Tax=Gigaspora margarita TaxID=4874 RepID=A0A8H3XEU2_GIGMA|nr:hypothetical protein F8M41_001179 [Gigaspora margarita]